MWLELTALCFIEVVSLYRSQLFQVLFLFVEARAQRGLPLLNLRIISTARSRMADEMDELRRHVANVEHSNEEPGMIAPVGWPTDIFLWIASRRDARARRW